MGTLFGVRRLKDLLREGKEAREAEEAEAQGGEALHADAESDTPDEKEEA